MKKRLVVGLALLFALSAISVSFAAVKGGKISLKAGDEIYVCGCGEKCDCGTISKKPGKCSCDKDLVKGTVSKVVKGKAYVIVDGKERVFKTTGKFQCPCGPSCDCDTISQKPGKCACGKDLEQVGKKKK
jgi:hypothetical protein